MKKILSISILIIFLVATFSRTGAETHANNFTNDAIKEMENEINNTKDEKKKLEDTLTNVENIKKNLEASRNDLAKFIEELDTSLETIEQNILDLLGLIEVKEGEIEVKTEELAAAREVQREQYEAMKIRVKFMYERGETYYLSMLFGAENLSDMLNMADYIEMLSQYDREKLEEYISFSEYVALCKENLEGEKELLDQAKAAVETEKKAIEDLIVEKEKQIEAVMGDITRQEQAIREYEADIAAQNAVIKALEKAVADEKARLAAENARRYDGGLFAFPVPSFSRISEEYGNRIHPILGVPQFHNGIDIAAPTGNSIVSAYGGKVISTGYNATMGNFVMIDHGDSVFTIYMHCSQILISDGAEVSRGQKIATVGSTGRSTGPHLHFSVRVNGQYVSPWNYLGGR